MRIAPVSYRNITFKSKVKEVCDGYVSDELKEQVDKFEETRQGAKNLGSGLFASAYLLNGTNFVIKESLPGAYAKEYNKDFYPEANALSLIPDGMKNVQRLVGRVKTENNNYYLISTFLEGKGAKFPTNKWDDKALEGLVNMAYNFDVSGIYHNDLNESNCLINENKDVGAIDFQFTKKFSPEDIKTNDKEFKTPPFMMPSNLMMFEMASFPWYILDMGKTCSNQEVREFFKEYLAAKSEYCEKRADYLETKREPCCSKMEEYERLQAYFYKNPDDKMINLQAKKLQLMYNFRKAFSIVDSNENPKANIFCAISAYVRTIQAAKEMTDAAIEIRTGTRDELLKEFMDFEIDFGKYWENKMLEELAPGEEYGTWGWVVRNAQLKPKHEYFIFEDEDTYSIETLDLGIPKGENLKERLDASLNFKYTKIHDIASIITSDKTKSEFIGKYGDQHFEELKELVENNGKNLKYENKGVSDNSLEGKYNSCVNEVLNSYGKGDFYSLLNGALKQLYLGNLLNDESIKNGESKGLLDTNLPLMILKKTAEIMLNQD